ncbi:MAG: hypothetical protein EAX96_16705 [Candidatus Lokiarchaeota archaeon]|nr:hypothetical protein [Candidatus Lokiarchaeota archaeon]
MKEIITLAIKNLKFKLREPQQYLFIFGFPLIFLFIFWIMFSRMSIGNHNQFDIFFWGLLGFSTAFATQSASVAFSQEKESGTLKRLLTTPVANTSYIFTGFILSEIIIIVFQLTIMYLIAFIALGVYFANIIALFVNYGMFLLLGIFCIGIGLILAALLNAKLAGEMPMLIIMPLVFLSGIFISFSSPILYVNPIFWTCAFAKQIGYAGSNLLDTIEIFDLITMTNIDTGIAVWVCIPMIIAFALGFLAIGVILFKRKIQK